MDNLIRFRIGTRHPQKVVRRRRAGRIESGSASCRTSETIGGHRREASRRQGCGPHLWCTMSAYKITGMDAPHGRELSGVPRDPDGATEAGPQTTNPALIHESVRGVLGENHGVIGEAAMSANLRPAYVLNPPPALKTPRLRLRPPRLDDASEIFARYAQDPEVTRYLTWRPHNRLEAVQEFLRSLLALRERGAVLPWVVQRETDG